MEWSEGTERNGIFASPHGWENAFFSGSSTKGKTIEIKWQRRGRYLSIQIYESRKQEKWKHPVLNYSLTYARTIELEARLLEKEWTGNSGLFAQLRLR